MSQLTSREVMRLPVLLDRFRNWQDSGEKRETTDLNILIILRG